MKYHALALIAAFVAVLAISAPAADSQEVMLKKLFGTAKPALAPPLALTAHALVGADNSIAVSAWSGGLVFQGKTFDRFTTTFAITDPTANQTVTYPNGTGTVGLQRTAALAAGSAVSFAPASSVSCYTLVPAQDETVNAVTTGAISGRFYALVVTTSGTTSYTLTFATAFKTTGTLATGTTTGKVFVINFLFDGTNFNEVSRTTAM
jgi:hypothetical protein